MQSKLILKDQELPELKWIWDGTGMELEWNWDGIEMVLKWN